MATARVQLSATIDGLGSGTHPLNPASNTYAAANGTRSFVNLSSGNNTITVPSGAHAVVIIPPSGNSTAMTLKGTGTDAGIAMAVAQWSCLAFSEASPPATFVINAGGAITGVELVFI